MAKRTPLYQNHLNHGGKVVEFGGFELPVQYGAGLMAENGSSAEEILKHYFKNIQIVSE